MAEACTQGIDTGFVALGYGKVAFLGVVQGITELLPISSTAHMRVVPALLGWQDPGSAFSAAMQMAALAAVVSYFWTDMRDIVLGSTRALVRRDFADWHFRFAVWIVLATLPIAIFGLALSLINEEKRKPILRFTDSLSEVMFKFTGLVMYMAPLGVGGAIAAAIGTEGFGVFSG